MGNGKFDQNPPPPPQHTLLQGRFFRPVLRVTEFCYKEHGALNIRTGRRAEGLVIYKNHENFIEKTPELPESSVHSESKQRHIHMCLDPRHNQLSCVQS